MDSKEFQLISHFYKKIIKGKSDERDIYSFLMLIREYSPKPSPVREFGDFIAHRERDRGKIKDYLDSAQDFFYKYANDIPSSKNGYEVKPVFTMEEIYESFNITLKNIGFPNLDQISVRNIMLCIMSLLQNVAIYRIVNSKKKSKKILIGRLYITMDKKNVTLFGRVGVKVKKDNKKVYMVLEIMSLEHLITDIALDSGHNIFENILEVINVNGETGINFTDYSNHDF